MAEADDTAAIEALTEQFVQAFSNRDYAALGAMYANDAVLLPPNSNIITGKGNIQMFWERSRRIREMKIEPISVKPLGPDVMREVGTLHLKIRGPQGEGLGGGRGGGEGGPQAREFSGKYISVWQKVDGEWKIETSIWNRIGPERRNFPLGAAIRRPPQRGGPRGI